MAHSAFFSFSRTLIPLSASVFLFVFSGCTSGFPDFPFFGDSIINKSQKFSSKTYGAKASPRLKTDRNIKKGGGRRQIGKPYKIKGKWYRPKEEPEYDRTGKASWYGPNFHGRLTANGEIYDQFGITAAHTTFPLPSYARVTNLENEKSLIVRVNDRGPFHGNRIIDLSAGAANLLDYQNAGIAKVRVEYLGWAPLHGLDETELLASYREAGEPAHDAAALLAQTTIPADAKRSNRAVAVSRPVRRPKLEVKNEILEPVTRETFAQKKAVAPASAVATASSHPDPFIRELETIKNLGDDTGSTLALRLRRLITESRLALESTLSNP